MLNNHLPTIALVESKDISSNILLFNRISIDFPEKEVIQSGFKRRAL